MQIFVLGVLLLIPILLGFGFDVLPVLLGTVIVQSLLAFVMSRNTDLIKITLGAVVIAAVYFWGLPSLASGSEESLAYQLLSFLVWASTILVLFMSTILGCFAHFSKSTC